MKVNKKDIPDEYKDIVSEDMSMSEIQFLGEVILRQKISNLKIKWHRFWRKKKG